MKKMLNTSMIYFIAAIAAGVFYREFTKWQGFTGKTMLAFVHTHLFVFGMILFLILALFCSRDDRISESKIFKCFFIFYNSSLPFMVCMMLIRGVLQVKGAVLSKAADAAISGIAGISHILLTASLVLLFMALKKICRTEE